MSIVDNIKDVVSVVQQAGNLELYQKLLDLQRDALGLVEENFALKKENNTLRETDKLESELVAENSAYWRGAEKVGPYCTRCWDAERKLVHLHPDGNPAYFRCPNCKADSVKAKPDLDRPVMATIHYPGTDEWY